MHNYQPPLGQVLLSWPTQALPKVIIGGALHRVGLIVHLQPTPYTVQAGVLVHVLEATPEPLHHVGPHTEDASHIS